MEQVNDQLKIQYIDLYPPKVLVKFDRYEERSFFVLEYNVELFDLVPEYLHKLMN